MKGPTGRHGTATNCLGHAPEIVASRNHIFLSSQQRWRGDIETVSVWNESPLTATSFHRSLPNLYSMFIPMKYFICSFMKKWPKLLSWQPFLFLSFNAYLSVCSLNESMNFLYFHNTFIKVQHNFSVVFCKFWQKLLPWQHFHLAIFFIYSL